MRDIDWCHVMSTEGHAHCTRRRECDCPCHYARQRDPDPKRPHSCPRERWAHLSREARFTLARRAR